jgi:hypothetical protein
VIPDLDEDGHATPEAIRRGAQPLDGRPAMADPEASVTRPESLGDLRAAFRAVPELTVRVIMIL